MLAVADPEAAEVIGLEQALALGAGDELARLSARQAEDRAGAPRERGARGELRATHERQQPQQLGIVEHGALDEGFDRRRAHGSAPAVVGSEVLRGARHATCAAAGRDVGAVGAMGRGGIGPPLRQEDPGDHSPRTWRSDGPRTRPTGGAPIALG